MHVNMCQEKITAKIACQCMSRENKSKNSVSRFIHIIVILSNEEWTVILEEVDI